MTCIYYFLIGHKVIPERQPDTLPWSLTKYKGSTHWVLNFEAVKFALEQPIYSSRFERIVGSLFGN